MIDIPIGKAIIAVEDTYKTKTSSCVARCFFGKYCINNIHNGYFKCSASSRKDGKDVIFKKVDYKDKKEVKNDK
jgi:hypothetical protein